MALLAWLCLTLASCATHARATGVVNCGDTASLVPDDQWYDAERDFDLWVDFARQWTGTPTYHCLDLYSASQGLLRAITRQGFRAQAYDIKTGGLAEDVTTREGFKNLVVKGLDLVPNAFICGGPPCSMFVFMSSSQHMRHLWTPLGCPWDRATLLGNLISKNTATFLRIIREVRRVWVVLEQPRNSWMFKCPWMVALFAAQSLVVVSAYLCYWGHAMEKPTHLAGDLPGLNSLHKTLPKAMRDKFRKKRERCNKDFKPYVRTANGKVHGTKDLAASAAYPTRFCTALAKIWVTAFRAALAMEVIEL